MKRWKYITVVLIAVFALHGCGSSSIGNGGSSGEEAVSQRSIQILGIHYEAHKKRLEEVFQLSASDDAFDILNEYKAVFENQTLDSTYMNASMKLYAKACEEVSLEVIPLEASFADVFFMLTGVVAGSDENQLASDIDALFAGETDDYKSFAYCLSSATSFFGLTYIGSF